MPHSIECKVENSKLFIYVDEELWREGSVSILSRRPSLPKTCNSLEDLSKIYSELEYKGAKCYAYKRIAAQSLSSFDLQRALKSKLVSSAISEQIVKEFQEQGYINDQAWMESFIRVQQQRRASSKIIFQKLRFKGYLKEQIDSVLSSQNEEETIRELMDKKYAKKDLRDYSQRNKVIAALVRKGFSLEQVLKVVRIT